MEKSDENGLPLFAAIRAYSDPAAWAELESLLSINVDPGDRSNWTPDDWGRYDFLIKLPLGLAFSGSGSPAMPKIPVAWHRWTRLRTAFQRRLKSGELSATGFVSPLTIDAPRIVVPPDKWRILKLDFGNSTAYGEGLKVVSILVRHVTPAAVLPTRRVVKRRPRGGPRPGEYLAPLNEYLEFLYEKNHGLDYFYDTPLNSICENVRQKFDRSELKKYNLPSRTQLEKRIKEFRERKRHEIETK